MNYPFIQSDLISPVVIDELNSNFYTKLDEFKFNGAGRKFYKFNASELKNSFLSNEKKIMAKIFKLYDYQDYYDFVGYVTKSGSVHIHNDENIKGHIHCRINTLILEPESGGDPIIDSRIININKNQSWLCLAGHSLHGTTAVKGDKPRSILSFGYQVPKENLKEILKQYKEWSKSNVQ